MKFSKSQVDNHNLKLWQHDVRKIRSLSSHILELIVKRAPNLSSKSKAHYLSNIRSLLRLGYHQTGSVSLSAATRAFLEKRNATQSVWRLNKSSLLNALIASDAPAFVISRVRRAKLDGHR